MARCSGSPQATQGPTRPTLWIRTRVRRQPRILLFVSMRLALEPFWARFLVLMPVYAVFFGVLTYFEPDSLTKSLLRSVGLALFFGVTVAGFVAYQGKATHKRAVEAVAGLDKTERSQAIAAITGGVVPADPAVRYAAVRLGSAYLGGKSVDEQKRRERRAWITSAIIVALMIVWAVTQTSAYATVYFLALGLIVAIALPLSLLRGRRLQRNYAQLSEGLPLR